MTTVLVTGSTQNAIPSLLMVITTASTHCECAYPWRDG